jgi:hypothetical protein
MSKKNLIKRLSWYYPLEKMHAFLTFPTIAIYFIFTNPISNIIYLLYGLTLCIFILFQGQLYWKLKLHSLQGKSFEQEKNLTFFRKSRKVNLFMILLIPVVFFIQLFLNNWTLTLNTLTLWGFAANAFGVLEHVNYYHTQLMIDNTPDLSYLLRNRKLKKASLAKDLSENSI